MSTTIQQREEFATYILNHPAKQDVVDSITMKLMRSFQKGSPEIRAEAVKTLDSIDLFFSELNIIASNAVDLTEDTIENVPG